MNTKGLVLGDHAADQPTNSLCFFYQNGMIVCVQISACECGIQPMEGFLQLAIRVAASRENGPDIYAWPMTQRYWPLLNAKSDGAGR
jgi:hypothetical protein